MRLLKIYKLYKTYKIFKMYKNKIKIKKKILETKVESSPFIYLIFNYKVYTKIYIKYKLHSI